MPNETAPEGSVYVCMACGKMSYDKYGDRPINKGWDESCMLWSQLWERKRLVLVDGRVREILDGNRPAGDSA